MKVWPIDPLVPLNLRLEVPEKLPQGLTKIVGLRVGTAISHQCIFLLLVVALLFAHLVASLLIQVLLNKSHCMRSMVCVVKKKDIVVELMQLMLDQYSTNIAL